MYILMSNPYLPEFVDVEKTVLRSFRERWIEPILHGITIPFEPWVKTKVLTTRERTWYYMGTKIVAHPNNIDYVRRKFGCDVRWSGEIK